MDHSRPTVHLLILRGIYPSKLQGNITQQNAKYVPLPQPVTDTSADIHNELYKSNTSNIASISDLSAHRVESDTKNINQSVAHTPSTDGQSVEYDKIPHTFSLSTWPLRTNIKCWKCDRFFKTRPYFVATKYIKDPTGCFCSAPCAMAYIKSDVPKVYWFDAEAQLYELYYIFNGIKAKTILQAPVKTLRHEYGGIMSDEEYENNVSSCVKT
jgi:hypothetical protein